MPHVPTRLTDTAALIRAALKRSFPATKFSVRSDRDARGSAVHVSWTDGPAVKLVERVVGVFEGRGSGARYVFASRSYSDAFTARALAKLRRDGFEWDGDEGSLVRGFPEHARLRRLVRNAALERHEAAFGDASHLDLGDLLLRVRHAFMVA